MEKKKKGVMQSIPGWAWVLISLAAAILLWYALSINPKTARSFPFIPAILEAAKRMIDNGALGQDFCSSMISILAGFALGFITAVPIAFLMACRSEEFWNHGFSLFVTSHLWHMYRW